MKLHVIQHVAHEGPGAVAAWAEARGHSLATTRLDRGEPLPAVGFYDLLVVMGGPMSANDEAIYPWLAPEKRAIEAALRADRGVLGICLGSQILASVLGARVYPTGGLEVGWLPVRTRPAAAGSRAFSVMPRSFTPFHWHGETFDLPSGATHLAETDACAHQAFELVLGAGSGRARSLALGLQFHMEATESTVRAMVEADGASLESVPGAPAPGSLTDDPKRWSALRPLLDGVLDRLTAPGATPPSA